MLISPAASFLFHFSNNASNMRIRVVIQFLTAALWLHRISIHAFPSQAGSCRSNGDALGGAHFYNSQVGGGPLSDHGLELRLDGKKLASESFSQITAGTKHSLELVATSSGKTFRGFLMRIESLDIDTTEVLSVPSNANEIQVPSLCVNNEGVGGLTHTGPQDKTRVQGFLQVDDLALLDMFLEVTVVVQNSVGVSEWYFSEYTFEAKSAQPPTPEPITATKAPTSKPTMSSTSMPSLRPSPNPTTMLPTSASVSPTMEPSVTRTASPTLSPISPPTQPPVAISTNKPTEVPVTSDPSKKPTESPSISPSHVPTRAPSRNPTGNVFTPLPSSQVPSMSEPSVPQHFDHPLTHIDTKSRQ